MTSQVVHNCGITAARMNATRKSCFASPPSPFMETTAYFDVDTDKTRYSPSHTVANTNTKAKRIDNSRLEA